MAAPAACDNLAAGALQQQVNAFLDLGQDVLPLIASWCGRSAPVLAHACRATMGVWQHVKREPELLARVLLTARPQAAPDGGCSTGGSALAHLFRHRRLPLAVGDADAVRVLLPELDRYAAQHPEAAAQEQEYGAFLVAIHRGHVATTALLLARATEQQVAVALLVAADVGRAGVVQAILPHCQTGDINNALVQAAAKGDAAMARLLVESWEGPPLELHQSVFAAISHGTVEVLEALLSRGLASGRWDTLLVTAVDHNDLPALELFLQRAAPQQLEPALMEAVRSAVPEMVRALLHAGADVHCHGEWPVWVATHALLDDDAGNAPALEVLELLLQHGADAATVLPAARAAGRRQVVALLQKHL